MGWSDVNSGDSAYFVLFDNLSFVIVF